ncbi:2-dehydropantoate 2-reductase [Leminorella grimontii]|uniref:2-dehydropantoate 2-reductase n=1 Tax=Leminorella grimontii TaxID=82981 RepID=UPI00207FF759|nr:2-dehydropantoate 2-reductase [Leminorella grimontii]GKX60950.1 2-dehydropantoate 2-reductase [Leminorella grimontii]
MRILVVGAGAVGGYFGGRLLQASQDVTFLVRPARAQLLKKNGLVLRNPQEPVITFSNPPIVLEQDLTPTFDLILLSCKAYDLDGAMNSFAAAVGKETAILPLLNGMRHVQTLSDRFGKEKILGGLCNVVATLDESGAVHRMTPVHNITFGELDGTSSKRTQAITEAFSRAEFNSQQSDNILLSMWEKWLFLSSLAASTCLMRAPIGEIVAAPGGKAFILALIDEIKSIAQACGYSPSAERAHQMLTEPGSSLTASMYRDLQQGYRIEADQIVGDLLLRAKRAGFADDALVRLRTAYVHMKAYESQRKEQT